MVAGTLNLVPGEEMLEDARRRVDTRLSELLPQEAESPTELHAAMRYSALATGKRLRPALAMASSLAVGGSEAAALDAGCAIELVHCFSLIHDDLPAIDNDDLRRGRPTCHVKFGEAMAILAGDALFALSFEILAGCSDDARKIAACVGALAHASGSLGLVGGEVLDIQAEERGGDQAHLQTIHSRKTGALIGASCRIGGILGGGDAIQCQHLQVFGEKIGLAFQIADDILNETSTAEQLGKAVGSDRALNKLTYPALIGLDQSIALGREVSEEALSHLAHLPGDTSALRTLANYVIDRHW